MVHIHTVQASRFYPWMKMEPIITKSRLILSLSRIGLALIIGAALMNEVRAQSSTTPEQLIAAYTTLPKGKNKHYYLSMHVKKTGKNSWGIVDTGSTGVRASANFLGLTAQEKQGTCVHNKYSSSGNNYAGYVINRDITLRSTLKSQTNVVSADNLPVFAVVQSCEKGVTAQCSAIAPKGCTNTPKVFMMGVGLGQYSKASPPPINPANQFLNIQKMANKQLPQSYLATECDMNMSLVNQKARTDVPADWRDVIKRARKEPFTVVEMTNGMFLAFQKR